MTALLGFGAAVAAERVPAGRGRRAVARPDEDAVTLGVQAAGALVEQGPLLPRALILATLTPPYENGGSTQLLAELLGLQGDLFTCELTSTPRDGLAAVRLATALADGGGGPVLVIAAHADREDTRTGDGAVALLVGDGPGEALADITSVASHAEEVRDRWRLAGTSRHVDADRSFVQTIGTDRLGRAVVASAPGGAGEPMLVVGPDARSADRLERELGGPGDSLVAAVGNLGTAHPLLRMLLDLDGPGRLVALASGLADVVRIVPGARAATVRASVRAAIAEDAVEVDRIRPYVEPADFAPYASVPRAWRDRPADLRLVGTLGDPAHVPGRRLPTGKVVTWTRDHVFPTGAVGMAAVDLDGGGRFFGQVASGASVAIGDPIRLVPRRLHTGGGLVQYFWKVAPCR